MRDDAKVLVDTSVWIDFLAGDQHVVAALRGLIAAGKVIICGQIMQEVLQGSRDRKAFNRLSDEMRIWDAESEEPDDFREAGRIFAELRWKGITVPPTDCLIAAVALRRKLPLFTRDADFDHVPGLKLYEPLARSSKPRPKTPKRRR